MYVTMAYWIGALAAPAITDLPKNRLTGRRCLILNLNKKPEKL